MSFRLLACGDVAPTAPPSSPGFADVTRTLRGADAVFANLEMPLTRSGSPADKIIRFRADPGLAEALAAAGVTVATCANNHMLDYGSEGMADTLAALRKAGVQGVGAGTDLDEALHPAIIGSNDFRIAFIGLASTLPNGCGAAPDRSGVAPVRVLSRFLVDTVTIDEEPGMSPLVETTAVSADVDRAVRAVSDASRDADAVVVACHWGVPEGFVAPYQGELADYQRPLAHALIDAGADAVVGHHPHVLHGIELYRDRPIFYSLGNFLFHPLAGGGPVPARSEPRYSLSSLHGTLNRHGALARLTWESPGRPSSIELVPVWLDDAGEPVVPDDETARFAIDRVQALSGEPAGPPIRTRRDGASLVAAIGS